MSYAIQTIDGVTSEATFKLEKRYVRVGRGEECDLRVLNDGAPYAAFLLFNSSPGVYEIRCRASNSVVYSGRVLKREDAVVWEVGADVEVGGCATLRLTDGRARDAARSSRTKRSSSSDSSDRASRASSVDASKTKRPSRSATPPPPPLAKRRDENAAPEARIDDENAEKKSQPLLPILVVVLCVVGILFLLLGDGRKLNGPYFSQERDYGPLLTNYLHAQAQRGGLDDSIFQDYQHALLKAPRRPQDALDDYREIRRKLLENREKLENQEKFVTEDGVEINGTGDDDVNYVNALKGINQKIDNMR